LRAKITVNVRFECVVLPVKSVKVYIVLLASGAVDKNEDQGHLGVSRQFRKKLTKINM